MLKEISDMLMYEDGKQHMITVSGNELIVVGELKILNSTEMLVVCTDLYQNEQYFLSSEITEQLNKKVVNEDGFEDYYYSLIIPCALTYFIIDNKYYRAFKIINIDQRQYYLAVTINGLIKAIDAEHHKPVSKNKVKELVDSIKVNSYVLAMKKQMYRRILML